MSILNMYAYKPERGLSLVPYRFTENILQHTLLLWKLWYHSSHPLRLRLVSKLRRLPHATAPLLKALSLLFLTP